MSVRVNGPLDQVRVAYVNYLSDKRNDYHVFTAILGNKSHEELCEFATIYRLNEEARDYNILKLMVSEDRINRHFYEKKIAGLRDTHEIDTDYILLPRTIIIGVLFNYAKTNYIRERQQREETDYYNRIAREKFRKAKEQLEFVPIL